MRIRLFIWLLFAAFSSYAQTPIGELWSKEDSVAKTRPAIPSGYGSFYYNKYKAQWWTVENGVRKRAFPSATSYSAGSGLTLTGSAFKLGGTISANTFLNGAFT